VQLAYQIAAVTLIIASCNIALLLVQAVMLLLLFVVRPYLKPIEKIRSMFMFFILLLSNLLNLLPITSIAVPAVLLSLLALHLAITAYVTTKSSYLEFVKKCTQRSEVVRGMFVEKKDLTRDEQIEQQKEVTDQLIKKYHNLNLN
jgi:predicted membrane protein